MALPIISKPAPMQHVLAWESNSAQASHIFFLEDEQILLCVLDLLDVVMARIFLNVASLMRFVLGKAFGFL